MLGRGYISHYSEYALSSTLSIYITLIAIVLWNIMLFSHAIVDFHLFYDGAVDMQIWSLLTRRWLKLTEQDKTGTQLIAFIHWIKDLSLESVHWNLKFIGHKSVFRFLRNNPCSSSSQSFNGSSLDNCAPSVCMALAPYLLDDFFTTSFHLSDDVLKVLCGW